MQQGQDIKPAFEVEILEGNEMVTRQFFDDGILKKVEESVPKGWMVYFPAGHSIRVRSETELRRLGFHNAPNLLDMESDDEGVIGTGSLSLKENARRKTRSRKKSASTGGIMKDG